MRIPLIEFMSPMLREMENALYDLDCAIETGRLELNRLQPFGHHKVDLRWYLSSRAFGERLDPVPVRYIRRTAAQIARGAPKWGVTRLDRHNARAVALHRQLRRDGWPTSEQKALAVAQAREIHALLRKRTLALEPLGQLTRYMQRAHAACVANAG